MKAGKLLILLFLPLALVAGCKPQSKEELLQGGLKYVAQDNWKGAIVMYRNALEKDPSYFEARYQLAIAYLNTGKLEQAEREFEKVGRQNPALVDLPLHLAELYLLTDRADRARAEVEGYLRQHPESTRALDLLGRSRALLGDPTVAKEYFTQALRIDPHYHSAQTNLALAHLQLRDEEGAGALLRDLAEKEPTNRPAMYLLARLEAAQGQREPALFLYRRLIESDQSDAQAHYLAGSMALSLGQISEAEKHAADLAARFPEESLGAELSGLIFYQRQEFESAIVQLQKANRTRPTLTAYYFLGLSYYQSENFELALNNFQKVLDYAPQSIQTRNMVAMTLLRQERVDDAIREAQLALFYEPKSGLAHNILGSAYMVQGQFDRAMEEFDRAIALDPNLVDAHVKKGVFNLSQGKFEQGEEEMLRAMTIAPEVLDSRLLLAKHYLRRQNYADAIKILQEGMQGRPEDAALHNLMAGAFFAQNQPEKGIEALQAAKKIDPAYFTPYFNLATWYQRQGDVEKARAECDAVLARDPSNVRALVNVGQIAEIDGREDAALAFYERAMATQEIDGFIAMILFQAKRGDSAQVLATAEEALKRHPTHAPFLEIKGQALLRNGRPTDAAAVYEQLEKASPGQGFPTLVRIWLQQNEREKAEAVARQILQVNPKAVDGYLLQASIHEMTGEPGKALELLVGARARVKGEPRLELQIGTLYQRAGEMARAMETYRALLRSAPQFTPAVFALGAAHDGSGNKQEALKLYQQALRIEKDYTPALNNLAYLYAENYGNAEEGLSLARQAARNEPSRPEIMDTLGYLLVRNGRAAEAIPILERAAAMLPHVPTVLYHLAMAYQGAGEKAKAADSLRNALALGDFPELAAARTLLAQLEQ